MKRIYLVIIAAALIFPILAYAAIGLPMGGVVVAQYPCNTGFLLYVSTAIGVMPYMWFYGELPFSSYIPPHPGQWLLGEVGPVVVPCFVGPYPIGAGFPMIYHGSSL